MERGREQEIQSLSLIKYLHKHCVHNDCIHHYNKNIVYYLLNGLSIVHADYFILHLDQVIRATL